MTFIQITYLRDRRLSNLISLNHRLSVFACCQFYNIYYFIFCSTDKCHVNFKHLGTDKVLGGAGGCRQLFHPLAKHTYFSCPMGLYRGQLWKYHRIPFLLFIQFDLCKNIHATGKLLILVTLKVRYHVRKESCSGFLLLIF